MTDKIEDDVEDIVEEHMSLEYMTSATAKLKTLLDIIPDIGVSERKQFIDCYFRNIWSVVFNRRLRKIEKDLSGFKGERKGMFNDSQFVTALFFKNREHLLDAVLKAEQEREENE